MVREHIVIMNKLLSWILTCRYYKKSAVQNIVNIAHPISINDTFL